MKVWNYVYISLGLVLFLHFAGIPTAAEGLFDLVGLSTNSTTGAVLNATPSSSGFFNELFQDTGTNKGILALLVGAGIGIAASFFTRAKPENLILLPLITSTLTLFLMSMVGVMQVVLSYGSSWISAIIVLLILPYTIGFILALAEFFRGTD